MLHRYATIENNSVTKAPDNGDVVVELAFASESPVERWFGTEILDHSTASVRLGRLNDGAPVLFNHDKDAFRGSHLPNTARIDKDRVLRGKVSLTAATHDGRETIALVESKQLQKASVGYRIHKVKEQTTKQGRVIERELDGAMFERVMERCFADTHGDVVAFRRTLDAAAGAFDRSDDAVITYRVTDWEPYENSLVTVPADNSVGLGRAGNEEVVEARDFPRADVNPAETAATTRKGNTMSGEANGAAATIAEEKPASNAATTAAPAKAEPTPNAVDLEKARVRAIENLCRMNKLDENYRNMWVSQGIGIEAVTEDMLRILEERGKTNPQPATKLGLTPQDTQRFSLMRAITACADNNWVNAPFEMECSREISKRLNKQVDPKRFYVPFEVIERQHNVNEMLVLRQRLGMDTRDLTAAVAGAGGYLISTDNIGFIEILRNRSVAFRMGARRLSGLQGNVTIPRQSASATAYWLSTEATAITESQPTFVQASLTPHNVGAYTEISRQLLLQSSPGAEGIVSDDLAQVVATAADLAVLNGSGSGGQPLGIIGTSGIGGFTGTTLGLAGLIEAQTDVATANVTPARGGYVTNPTISGLLMARQRFSGTDTPLWVGNVWDGIMLGFPAMTSNQIPAGDLLFGDWQEVVVGEWGVLEVDVNPYANFQAGIIGVRAMYSMDVAVRRPFAFSLGTSIT